MHLMVFKLNLNFFCLNLKIHAVKVIIKYRGNKSKITHYDKRMFGVN